MTLYKGIEIDARLTGVVRHMQGVEEYREVLGNLQAAWDTLTLLGQLSGTAAEMSSTREAFQRLTGNLLNHLGRETRNKVTADLRAKAQNAIDILVRNLFERTADIGFIAADDDVREYLQSGSAERRVLRKPMEERFQAYVDKYSVYSDIVLFATDGSIRARLLGHDSTSSQAPLIAEALSTARPYVEYFGEADFLPPGKHLVYAYRVQDQEGQNLGVMALIFRLDNEMAGIFGKLKADGNWAVLACVAPDGTVIASSSAIQLPVGSVLEQQVMQADGDVIPFAGHEYLAVTCRTRGYQGYEGPGWLGIGLIPLEFAFDRDDSTLLANVEPQTLEAVMQQPTLFSEGLRNIPRQAELIQEDLNRSVWNGSVRQTDSQGNAAFAKTLLWEIANAGRKTQAVFEQSISNLHQTVVAAILQDTLSCAALAIDVMDRNLYERANDCRWWALNATFRRVLAQDKIEAADAERCGEILDYINNLYTVYDNLLLLDARGHVVAVSRPAYQHLLGKTLNDEWVSRMLAIPDAQGYVVSEFTRTPLYDGRPTHVYAAAVRHPQDNHVVGGIAIVFDAEPQFAAMLTDSLPRDGNGAVVPEAFSLFLDSQHRVIASSSLDFAIASTFPAPYPPRGAQIVAIGNRYYAIGAIPSHGYREYKVSDGYRHDVTAVCGFPLGEVGASLAKPRTSRASVSNRVRRNNSGGEQIELATFFVGGHWFGVPATNVVEAIDSTGLSPASGAVGELVAGFRMHRDQLITIIRVDKLLEGMTKNSNAQQVVTLRTHGKQCIGLLVDELGEIPEVAKADIQPVKEMMASQGLLISGLVRSQTADGGEGSMLSILDVNGLCTRLGCTGCQEHGQRETH